MKNRWILPFLPLVVLAACSDTPTRPFESVPASPAARVPGATTCIECHETEYSNWLKTAHANPRLMQPGTDGQSPECAACHDDLDAHVAHPNRRTPQNIEAMTKTAQNRLCGSCHFNESRVGGNVIDPRLDHGLFSSAGFENKTHQLSCLDCHVGHGDHDHLLASKQANLCFTCHKVAIVTMGIFQPVNYLAGGKLCTTCHPPHGATKAGHAARLTVGIAAVCAPCHL